jgi:hypothetical protein
MCLSANLRRVQRTTRTAGGRWPRRHLTTLDVQQAACGSLAHAGRMEKSFAWPRRVPKLITHVHNNTKTQCIAELNKACLDKSPAKGCTSARCWRLRLSVLTLWSSCGRDDACLWSWVDLVCNSPAVADFDGQVFVDSSLLEEPAHGTVHAATVTTRPHGHTNCTPATVACVSRRVLWRDRTREFALVHSGGGLLALGLRKVASEARACIQCRAPHTKTWCVIDRRRRARVGSSVGPSLQARPIGQPTHSSLLHAHC